MGRKESDEWYKVASYYMSTFEDRVFEQQLAAYMVECCGASSTFK